MQRKIKGLPMDFSLLESSALIHCYLFDMKGNHVKLEHKNLRDRPKETDIIWLHLDLNASCTSDWLLKHSDIDELMIEAMIADETRPRCTSTKKGFLLILRGVNLNPGAAVDDMVSIRLWVEEHRIISVRRRQLSSVTDLTNQIEHQQSPSSSLEFIANLADHMTWRMWDTIESYEESLSELEEKVLTNSRATLRSELQNIRRQLITLQRYLSPQREALNRLQTIRMEWIEESQKGHLRETNDQLTRYLEDLAAMQERAIIVQEELSNNLAAQANSRVYLLSIITTIFLPLSFVTGLLGINVGGMPGFDDPTAFWRVVLVLSVMTATQLIIMRWKKWL